MRLKLLQQDYVYVDINKNIPTDVYIKVNSLREISVNMSQKFRFSSVNKVLYLEAKYIDGEPVNAFNVLKSKSVLTITPDNPISIFDIITNIYKLPIKYNIKANDWIVEVWKLSENDGWIFTFNE